MQDLCYDITRLFECVTQYFLLPVIERKCGHWDIPTPPLTVLYPLYHLQGFLRDALKALHQQRYTVLYADKLLQGAEVCHPAVHAAGVHLCHLVSQSIEHQILPATERRSTWVCSVLPQRSIQRAFIFCKVRKKYWRCFVLTWSSVLSETWSWTFCFSLLPLIFSLLILWVKSFICSISSCSSFSLQTGGGFGIGWMWKRGGSEEMNIVCGNLLRFHRILR